MADSHSAKHITGNNNKKVYVDLRELFPEKPEIKSFYLSLGRFIHYYSMVEQLLIVVLHQYANTAAPVALALFANWRPDQTITTLHRVIQARKLRGPKIVELKSSLQQISIITRVRNDLVHLGAHGTEATGSEMNVISNHLLAYSRKVRRQTPISVEILDRMYGDLLEISFRLISHLINARPRLKSRVSLSKFQRRKGNEPVNPKDFPYLFAGAFRRANPASQLPAWRYKQPALKKRRRKSRVRHPTRAAQRPPSRA